MFRHIVLNLLLEQDGRGSVGGTSVDGSTSTTGTFIDVVSSMLDTVEQFPLTANWATRNTKPVQSIAGDTAVHGGLEGLEVVHIGSCYLRYGLSHGHRPGVQSRYADYDQ